MKFLHLFFVTVIVAINDNFSYCYTELYRANFIFYRANFIFVSALVSDNHSDSIKTCVDGMARARVWRPKTLVCRRATVRPVVALQ